MPLKPLPYREVRRRLLAAGFAEVGQEGSHVKFGKATIETDTVVMRSVTGTVRRIVAEHREFGKFHLD